jgi:hypothetical protein
MQKFSEDGLRIEGAAREVIAPATGLNDVTGPKTAPAGKACLILASDRDGKVYEAFIER